MDIQTVFYWLGSTFVLMWLVLLLVIIVGTILLFRSINSTVKAAEDKLNKGVGGFFVGLIPLLPLVFEYFLKKKNKS